MFKVSRRRLPVFALLFSCLAALAFTTRAADFAVLTDDSGTVIHLAKKPSRIVSLTPSNTEILFALGLGGQIVGVTNYCDYPAAAKGKEKIGDINLNYEKIVALKPDLVLAVGSMQPEAIAKLRALGLTVMTVNPSDVAAVMAGINKIGKATGRAAAAEKLTASMRKRLEAVRGRLGELTPAQRPRVFVEIWMEPIMTAGPGTFTGELLQIAGGSDIAADARPWSAFSQELVIARNPQIIISQCNSAAQILKRPGWGVIDAVKNGRVYDVDQNIFSRPGPRLMDALELLAKLIHPEKFTAR